MNCLSAWLANLIRDGHDDAGILKKADSFFTWLQGPPLPVALVSLECGLGIMPVNQLAGRFGDLLGEINQTCSVYADTVIFVISGLPLCLMGNMPPGLLFNGDKKC